MADTLRSGWRRWFPRFMVAQRQRRRTSPWRKRPVLEMLEDRWLLSAYLVTSNADTNTSGTLRYGINQVNAGTYSEIDFGVGTVGSAQTINLSSVLPTISKPVFINGLSQGGSGNTTRLITLNGASAGTNADGLQLSASGCTVSGLIIEGFTKNGIEVHQSNNIIGGTTTGAGNVISGNGGDGVLINHVSGVGLQGNYIGANAAGTSALGNSIGVEVAGSNDTVGGTVAVARNVISGNKTYGVSTYDTNLNSPSGVAVQGNYIGTNAAGNSALGNGYGVYVAGPNTIGGTITGAGNVISANLYRGIQIAGSVLVQGNYVGTNAAGTSALYSLYGSIPSQLMVNSSKGNTLRFSPSSTALTNVAQVCVY